MPPARQQPLTPPDIKGCCQAPPGMEEAGGQPGCSEGKQLLCCPPSAGQQRLMGTCYAFMGYCVPAGPGAVGTQSGSEAGAADALPSSGSHHAHGSH